MCKVIKAQLDVALVLVSLCFFFSTAPPMAHVKVQRSHNPTQCSPACAVYANAVTNGHTLHESLDGSEIETLPTGKQGKHNRMSASTAFKAQVHQCIRHKVPGMK
jgi:hypothetical protein